MSLKNATAVLLSAVFCAHYIGLVAHSSMLPTYMDSFYSFGAGAKLAYTGHFSDTFMLHGLLNSYLVETIIRAGAAGQSYILARQAQAIWAAITLLGVYGSLRSLLGDRLSRCTTLLAASTMFLSTMTTIELLDIRPECPSMAGVSLLLWVCLSRYNRATPVFMGLVLAMLTAARPTNFLLFFPAVSVSFSDGLSGRISTGTLTRTLVIAVITCCLVLITLFPGYLVHAGSLVRQFEVFFRSRYPRTMDAGILLFNAALTAGYLWLAISGLFHALGLSVFLASIPGRHQGLARLRAFLVGTLPFILSTCLYSNFQSRYLLPIAPVLFVCSIMGYSALSRRGRILFLAGAAATGLVACYQGYEIWARKMAGGIADLLRTASEMHASAVSGYDESLRGETYGNPGDPPWPLLPFVSVDDPDRRLELYISDTKTREGYRIQDSTGVVSPANLEIKRSPNPGLTNLFVLIREPWNWRSWETVYLLVGLQDESGPARRGPLLSEAPEHPACQSTRRAESTCSADSCARSSRMILTISDDMYSFPS